MKKIIYLITILIVATFLFSCATTPDVDDIDQDHGVDFDILEDFSLDNFEQERQNDDVVFVKDIAYGKFPLMKFDVFYKESYLNAPVVYMVHGGAIGEGDKSNMYGMVKAYTDIGYTVITMNYRDTRDTDIASYDLACSIVSFEKIAPHFGTDASKTVVHGFSHGGYVSSIFTYDQDTNWLEACPIKSGDAHENIKAYIAHSANNLITKNIDSRDYPTLLVYGIKDPRFKQSELDAAQSLLDTAGVYNQEHLEDVGHGPAGHVGNENIAQVIQEFVLTFAGD